MHIGSSDDPKAVKKQYKTSDGLNIRLSFHDTYSTNKLGYGNWLTSNYMNLQGLKVLEVGCGTGSLWVDHKKLITHCVRFVFTDLSEGMIQTAKKNIGEHSNIEYRVADIQNLDFEDDSFDVVIANSMLYHVPDLQKGLKEVRRVLKDGGIFYCSTYGENNFTDKLAEWFALENEELHFNHNFTMQNGGDILKKVFDEVEPVNYKDSFHITNVDHLIEYLSSLSSFKSIMSISVSKTREILAKHIVDGAIDLPKEYGMFKCR